jgi:heme-degrading monooxygenase HmoA
MISRTWHGVARVESARDYIHHLQHDTFPQLSHIPGFVTASILRRPVEAGVEFLIVTTWQSMDSIRQFAGETTEVAVVSAAVQAMMVEYDKIVTHYEVVDTNELNPADVS